MTIEVIPAEAPVIETEEATKTTLDKVEIVKKAAADVPDEDEPMAEEPAKTGK